jgi:hypothetical protein
MGIFSKVKEARIGEGGNYLPPGDFDLEIKKVTVGTTRKNIPFMAVAFTCLGTNNPAVKVGEVVDWFNGADKDGFSSNVKEWGSAVLQNIAGEPIDPDSIDEAVMEGLTDKGGESCIGQKLRVKVTLKPIKSAPGKFFSRHQWFSTANPAS